MESARSFENMIVKISQKVMIILTYLNIQINISSKLVDSLLFRKFQSSNIQGDDFSKQTGKSSYSALHIFQAKIFRKTIEVEIFFV